jgi:lactoylglutathione lyase
MKPEKSGIPVAAICPAAPGCQATAQELARQLPGGGKSQRSSQVFSHVFVGVTDFDRAFGFYAPLMKVLDIPLRFCEAGKPWAGWQSVPGPRPLFLIGHAYNGQPHAAGNGQMIALLAANRRVVRDAYKTAMAHGGVGEGAPGLRPEYHEHYYGAYFRDLDSNKLCVACHVAEDP